MNKPRIIVVGGPTASGKSDIAIALARKLNGEIISADSRQVYRGMDIGTGKVPRDKVLSKNVEYRSTKKLRHSSFENSYFSSNIRHWLLDVASPTRQYTVAHFQRDARKAIKDILKRGKLPIICGGTGFWIDALVYNLAIPKVKPNRVLRAKLQKLSADELFARLKKLDPVRAKAIDRHNPVRLIRALEIVMSTGKPVPPKTNSSPYGLLYLGVTRPQAELHARIKKRLIARLRAGMVAEVKKLHTSGVSWKRLESFGLEYRWVAKYLQAHRLHPSEKVKPFRDELLRDIIAYSKRQLTWWKRNKEIRWIQNLNEAMILV